MDNLHDLNRLENSSQNGWNGSNEQTLNLLIVSGRSGSGKTSVINILEDFGYYAIDNLPLSLVTDAVDKLITDTNIRKIVFGVDVRTPRADLSHFADVCDGLHNKYGKQSLKVIYVTAQESVLVARFDATRRIHPLMANIHPSIKNVSNLPNALSQEISILKPVASYANITIDTSSLNIHELKETLRNVLGVDNQVTVNVLSFGFKHGSPIDSDFVFDVRILPNPHWEKELRAHTGLDQPVKEFFAKYPEVEEMGQDIAKLLNRWLPEFLNNNRHTVTVAIGCTGGKHRSVFISEMVAKSLEENLPKAMQVAVKHREKRFWKL